MLRKETQVQRPRRWDTPFGPDMDDAAVARLLATAPFCRMDPERFPLSCSLPDILRGDTRIVRFQHGDLIVREGDYGNSAFLVLSGKVRIALQRLPRELLGRAAPARGRPLRALANLLFRPRYPEVRRFARSAAAGHVPGSPAGIGYRDGEQGVRVFLQDVPRIVQEYGSLVLGEGEFFGEIAALSRTPRTATVFADGPAELLEIRWQGLRELMRRDSALHDHIHQLYRQNSLESHLRETPLLQHLSGEQLRRVACATQFETYGSFDWHLSMSPRQGSGPDDSGAGVSEDRESDWSVSLEGPDDHRHRASSGEPNEPDDPDDNALTHEPLIREEGGEADALLLIRSGFARLSQRYGRGHRTVAYLGKGKAYGLEELVTSWVRGKRVPLRYSLRAIGYVDVLRIPADVMAECVLPALRRRDRRTLVLQQSAVARHTPGNRSAARETHESKETEATAACPDIPQEPSSVLDPSADPDQVDVRTDVLDFLGRHHLINGQHAMLIDLDRCTRCDDCVRACAATHGNNPRFVRTGYRYESMMITHACMHCADPVCMIGCPTGAIGRDTASGAVTINDPTCIGCATCANACPYGNIQMVEVRDARGQWILDMASQQPLQKATKCDLCVDQWTGPACQQACPHDALVRIDLSNADHLAQWLAGTR